ncbi:MAG: hypothetical protein LBP64_03455 [Tannerella sp.]|jgi:predicted transposase/invertase (TIGR01784 family)|nr:hypothetical protein [Tannerella sp.]
MQLDRAEKYEFLQPVYGLSFVDDIFEKSPEMRDEYYHHYKTVNIKDRRKQIKGLETGMERGMEEGRKIMAASCLKKGLSPEEIIEPTGLTVEEIIALRDK